MSLDPWSPFLIVSYQNPFSGLIIWIYSIYAGTNWCQRSKPSHYQNPKVEIHQAADCENKELANSSQSNF